MFGVAYIATNTANNKRYVGITTQSLRTRVSQHLWYSREKPKTYFHKALKKYGPDVIKFNVVASALKKEWLPELEKQIIVQEQAEYNQTNGGEVTFGRKYDDKTKEIIRTKNIGKKRTLEQRKKISDIKKELFKNDAYKQKITEQLNIARNLVNENKRIQKVSQSAKNRSWSEESRKKLSQSCMGRVYDKSVIAKMRLSKTKKVLCVNTGIVFSDRHAAAQANGVSEKSVWRVCNKQFPSVKGLIFQYME